MNKKKRDWVSLIIVAIFILTYAIPVIAQAVHEVLR
jgi:hypothetical protein